MIDNIIKRVEEKVIKKKEIILIMNKENFFKVFSYYSLFRLYNFNILFLLILETFRNFLYNFFFLYPILCLWSAIKYIS